MIFNGEMVRAILDGRKTQTRRVIKNQREGESWSVKSAVEPRCPGHTHDWWLPTATRPYSALPRCQFGAVGDRIWVRETWAEAGANAPDLKLYRANYPEHVPSHYENVPPEKDVRWKPSIHMPRWASRILLEITDVRVERLNDISEEDARAEGIIDGGCLNCGEPEPCGCANPEPDATDAFAYLWQSIYGQENWNANPWVWVIEFKRIEGDGHAID